MDGSAAELPAEVAADVRAPLLANDECLLDGDAFGKGRFKSARSHHGRSGEFNWFVVNGI
jgi:hypothetical protein